MRDHLKLMVLGFFVIIILMLVCTDLTHFGIWPKSSSDLMQIENYQKQLEIQKQKLEAAERKVVELTAEVKQLRTQLKDRLTLDEERKALMQREEELKRHEKLLDTEKANYAPTEPALLRSQALEEDNDSTPSARGMAAFNRGEYDKAKFIWEQALLENPLNIELLQSLQMIYEIEGKFPQYLEIYHKLLQEHSDSTDLYANLARVWIARSQPEEAISLLKTGISNNPTDPEFRYLLADYLVEMGDYATAIDYYHSALSINPNDPQGHFFLGQLYSKIGSDDQANIEFEIASRLSIEMVKEIEDFRSLQKNSGLVSEPEP